MDNADLNNRFDYHPPRDEDTKELHENVRALCRTLAHRLNGLLPEGREKSLAITNLEQTMMWANAAIARSGS